MNPGIVITSRHPQWVLLKAGIPINSPNSIQRRTPYGVAAGRVFEGRFKQQAGGKAFVDNGVRQGANVKYRGVGQDQTKYVAVSQRVVALELPEIVHPDRSQHDSAKVTSTVTQPHGNRDNLFTGRAACYDMANMYAGIRMVLMPDKVFPVAVGGPGGAITA